MYSLSEGFIKIHRGILQWEWWDDIKTVRLFLLCLIKASWKDRKWHEMTIKRGQFVASLKTLSEESNLTVREVRTALKHLSSTKTVTWCAHPKFSVFTVEDYDYLQEDDTVNDTIPDKAATSKRHTDDKQRTDRRQAADKQATTVKEYKERKEVKEGKEELRPSANSKPIIVIEGR